MSDPKPQRARPNDEENMALCAIRYCLWRSSYLVADGVKWARHYGTTSPWVRRVVIRDIEELIRRTDWSPESSILIEPWDERAWREVLSDLKAMEAPSAEPG